MKFEALQKGKLIKRYKRFLTDISLEDGSVILAHCANSGSMKSCLEEGAEVYFSQAQDPKRKTKFTWEMIRIGEGWVGINTGIPNQVAFEWIRTGVIGGFQQYDIIRREVKWGDSRFDIFLANEKEQCFVEVKNVTLKVGDVAMFPDAVTTRGRKHLETLVRAKEQGIRAVMLYFVQRMDVDYFAPAANIDPGYAESLGKAMVAGVEVLVVQAKITPEEITFARMLPVY